MKPEVVLTHEFVEYIPDHLQDGILYISIPFTTVAHKCCCGCGNEVITPLSPIAWRLTFDGVSISLDPSIGNWGFPCKSHYWIRQNRVKWAPRWTSEEIAAGRSKEALAKQNYYSGDSDAPVTNYAQPVQEVDGTKAKSSFWQRLKRLLFRK